jgi:hypothetical protein
MQESAIDTRLLRHTGPIRELERGWLGHDAFQRRGQPAFEFSVCWLNAAFALSLNAVSCLQGVNNNAPMRVGSAPENYNTTGGYALYPGQPCTQFLRLWRRCCCCYFLTVLSLTLSLRLDSALNDLATFSQQVACPTAAQVFRRPVLNPSSSGGVMHRKRSWVVILWTSRYGCRRAMLQ